LSALPAKAFALLDRSVVFEKIHPSMPIATIMPVASSSLFFGSHWEARRMAPIKAMDPPIPEIKRATSAVKSEWVFANKNKPAVEMRHAVVSSILSGYLSASIPAGNRKRIVASEYQIESRPSSAALIEKVCMISKLSALRSVICMKL